MCVRKGVWFVSYVFRQIIGDRLTGRTQPFEGCYLGSNPSLRAREYNRGMDPEKINSWNLPEDPFERQARVSEIADEMCQQYDEIFFRVMNKVLEEVRANNLRNERQRNLGHQALQAQELPKTP